MTAVAGATLDGSFGASRRAPDEPYRGLEPLRFADAGILVARDEEIERLVRLVTMYRGVLLYGESGAGKSSVVNAGLLPRVVEDGFWPHRVRVQPRPGAEFVLEPIRAAAGDGHAFLPSAFEGAAADGSLVVAVDSFSGAVAAAAERGRILLVFDQFEELVTLFGEAAEDTVLRARVVDSIIRLLRAPDVRVKMLFVFREDYLANLEPLLVEQPELANQSVRLVPPPVEYAKAIIRAPFDRFAGAFGRELPDAVAAEVAASLAERGRGRGLNLSELQIVCLRLWKSEDPAALFAARGVDGLLEDFVTERLRRFEGDAGDLAVGLLTRLVTASGTRNVVSHDDLVAGAVEETGCDAAAAEETLRRLEGDAHLVRSERRREVTTYEIVSEFLVPMIAARKAERQAAAEASRAVAEAAALHEQELAARRRTMLKLAAAATSLVAVLVALLAAYAWQQRGRAIDEAHGARANELAAFADGVAENDPPLAETLALQSLSMGWTPEGENALRKAVSFTAPLVTLGDSESAFRGSCCVALSRNGRYITASIGNRVRVWTRAGGLVLSVPGGAFTGASPAFSPNSRSIVVNGPKHVLRQFDLATGRVSVRFKGHVDTAYSVAFSPDGKVVASPGADGFTYLWDADGYEIGRISTHSRRLALDDAGFSGDNRELITLRDDGLVEAWATPRPHHAPDWTFPRGTKDGVQSIVLAPKGELVATVKWNKVLELRNARTGRVIRSFGGPAFAVDEAAFDPTGKVVAALGTPGGGKKNATFRVWATDTGRLLGEVAPEGKVNDFALTAGGDLIATAQGTGGVLFDVRSGAMVASLGTGTGAAWNVALSGDGSRLVTAGADGGVRIWDVRHIRPVAVFRTQSKPVWSTAFSPQGDRLAIASEDGTVTLADTPTGRRLHTLEVSPGKTVYMVAFSPNGKLLATASKAGTVGIWNVARGTRKRVLDAGGPASAVAFSHDGRKLLTAGAKSVRVWNVANGARLATLNAGSTVEQAVFDADDRRIAAASDDGSVRIWDATDGRLIRRLKQDRGLALTVAFSPDGRYVAAGIGATSGPVVVWDASSGKRVALLFGRSDWTTVVMFRDDRHLLTAGEGGTVELWDWRTRIGAVVASSLPGGTSVSLSPDGRWLSAAGRRNTALLLPCLGCATLADVKASARETAHSLTATERQKYLHLKSAGER